MGGLSVWHLIIVLMFMLLWVIPLGLIFKKAGFNPLWAILAFFPLMGIVMVWVLACVEWPNAIATEA